MKEQNKNNQVQSLLTTLGHERSGLCNSYQTT